MYSLFCFIFVPKPNENIFLEISLLKFSGTDQKNTVMLIGNLGNLNLVKTSADDIRHFPKELSVAIPSIVSGDTFGLVLECVPAEIDIRVELYPRNKH